MQGNRKFFGVTVKQSLIDTISRKMHLWDCNAEFAVNCLFDNKTDLKPGTLGMAEYEYWTGLEYQAQTNLLKLATRKNKTDYRYMGK